MTNQIINSLVSFFEGDISNVQQVSSNKFTANDDTRDGIQTTIIIEECTQGYSVQMSVNGSYRDMGLMTI